MAMNMLVQVFFVFQVSVSFKMSCLWKSNTRDSVWPGKLIPLCVPLSYLLEMFALWACLVISDLLCTGCVTPPGTFFHLKMFMLMCLLLLHSSDSSEDTKHAHLRNLHLLVIADDLLRIQRLLLYGASFAKRMVVYSPISELFPSFSRDPFGSDTCMVNG